MELTKKKIRSLIQEELKEITQKQAVRRKFGALIQEYGEVSVPLTEKSHTKQSSFGSSTVTDRSAERMELTISDIVNLIQKRQYRKDKYTDLLIAKSPTKRGDKHFTLDIRSGASKEAKEAWNQLLKRMEEIGRVTS